MPREVTKKSKYKLLEELKAKLMVAEGYGESGRHRMKLAPITQSMAKYLIRQIRYDLESKEIKHANKKR